LPRSESNVEDIDFNPDDFIGGSQRPGGEVRQHCQPGRNFMHAALAAASRVRGVRELAREGAALRLRPAGNVDVLPTRSLLTRAMKSSG